MLLHPCRSSMNTRESILLVSRWDSHIPHLSEGLAVKVDITRAEVQEAKISPETNKDLKEMKNQVVSADKRLTNQWKCQDCKELRLINLDKNYLKRVVSTMMTSKRRRKTSILRSDVSST